MLVKYPDGRVSKVPDSYGLRLVSTGQATVTAPTRPVKVQKRREPEGGERGESEESNS